VPGRYEFRLPERPQRDGWFRLGSIDMTTTAVLVGLGIVSMFVYAFDKAALARLAFLGALVRGGDVWRVVTWPVVNPPDSIWVILTLVFFWFVGHRIEDHVGRKRFTFLILVMTVLPTAIATAFDLDAVAYTYGLGILGIGLLVVFALDNPGAMFFFGIPAWVLAAVYVGIDVLRYLGDRLYEPLLVELMVIVFALFGARQYGMVENLTFIPRLGGGGSRPAVARNSRAKQPRRSRSRSGQSVVAGPWAAPGPSPADQFELDALLDKISASGMDSLSRDEKQRLNDLSKRLRGT
jgi:membrane associated rhomboid family serine protease